MSRMIAVRGVGILVLVGLLWPASAVQAAQSPIGLMLGAPRLNVTRRIALVKELGVTYFRPNAIFVESWTGRCEDCEAARAAGLKLVLTVRNNGGGLRPASPPADLAAYRRTLGQVLDRYRPAVLVVENEENSKVFYLGTPEQYGTELRAACEVAHASGVQCTNGGLVSALAVLLVWDHYRSSGETQKAESFAARAFTPEERAAIRSPRAAAVIAKGKALLAQYRGAGVDLVNFHWYVRDPGALAETVAYLRHEVGLPVMTNEMGQHDLDPATATALLQEVLVQALPIAVWYSVDAKRSFALQDADGVLRANGEAFKSFVRTHAAPSRPEARYPDLVGKPIRP